MEAYDYSVGHFKPISSERFLTDLQEYIFYFTKGEDVKLNKKAIGVPYQDKTKIGRWKSATKDKRDKKCYKSENCIGRYDPYKAFR